MVGQIISHYRILEKLGEGGMGVVYKARDTRLDRFLAIKVLPPDKLNDPERKRRFVQEAKAASALNHPNIVAIYEIDSMDGVDFIAMEYAEGKTLDEWIGRKGLTLRETFRTGIQIADALAAAHAAGIVHRDLKPSNIMVGADGRVRVLDFGLAKLTEAGDPDLAPTQTMKPTTEAGKIVGTMSYMSPEQAAGRNVDARSDIFSFGVVLYEMLTRTHPFRRDTNMSTLAAIIHEDPKPWSALSLAFSPELERAVLRALRKEPGQRWQSMSDLKAVLEDLKESSESGSVAGVAAVSLPRRVRRWWILAAGLALIAAAGLAGWRLLRPGVPRGTYEMERVTFEPGLASFPSISPDGKMVAYASDREGPFQIYVQQMKSHQSVRLTHDDFDNTWPCFSPDGTKIAYQSRKDGRGIYIVDALGGAERKIASEGRMPRFSPDGSTIAYVVVTPLTRQGRFYLVPANGGSPRPFHPEFYAPAVGPGNAPPAWSPDGRYILFDGAREGVPTSRDWWVAPAAGGEAHRATAPPLSARSIVRMVQAWRGRYVYYSEGTTVGGMSLYRVPISPGPWRISGPPERLTSAAGMQWTASIAADGQMVFTSMTPNAGISWVTLHANEASTTGPMQQLNSDLSSKLYLTAAANGSRLAYAAALFADRAIEIRLRDAASGREDLIVPSAWFGGLYRLSGDGARFAYRDQLEGKLVTMVTDPGTTSARPVCEGCILYSFFSNGTDALVAYKNQLMRQSLATGARQPLLAAPGTLFDASLSPDGRRMAAIVLRQDGMAALYMAPAGPAPLKTDSWVQITAERNHIMSLGWSPDGSWLYFGSSRDGYPCVWAQRIANEAAPVGTPVTAYHSHQPNGMKSWESAVFAITPDKLYMLTFEAKGNIWAINVGRE